MNAASRVSMLSGVMMLLSTDISPIMNSAPERGSPWSTPVDACTGCACP